MWVAGLRGAMAYALALNSTTEMPESGRVILLVTLVYALFTILGVSSVLHPIMTRCEVTQAAKIAPAQGERSNNENWEEIEADENEELRASVIAKR